MEIKEFRGLNGGSPRLIRPHLKIDFDSDGRYCTWLVFIITNTRFISLLHIVQFRILSLNEPSQ